MSAATQISPILAPAASMRGTWRGRLTGWLASVRRKMPDDSSTENLGNHLRHDMGLPPGPSYEDRIWGVGGPVLR